MAKKGDSNRSETVGYVLGIISIVQAFFVPLAGFIFGVIGYIQSKEMNTPLAKKAKKLNIIGMVFSIVLFLVTILTAYFLASGGLNSLI